MRLRVYRPCDGRRKRGAGNFKLQPPSTREAPNFKLQWEQACGCTWLIACEGEYLGYNMGALKANCDGKVSHPKFHQVRLAGSVILIGEDGDDAHHYQEKQVRQAIQEADR